MIHLKKFNENNTTGIKELSDEQINNFNETELEQLIVCHSDGSDIYVQTLAEIVAEGNKVTHTEALDRVCDDISGNMLHIGWIENNKLLEVIFI